MHALVLALVAHTIAHPLPIEGLDKPVLTTTAKGAPSEGQPGSFVKVTCRVYRDFVLIEDNDPGNIGATRIAVAPRAAGSRAADACKLPPESLKVLGIQEVYVAGARGHLAILNGADGFGARMRFRAVDVRTGNTVFDRELFMTRPIRFGGNGDVVTLNAVVALEVECDATMDGCVKGALAKAGAPADLKVTWNLKPCLKDPQAQLQLGAPAHIADLSTPVVTFVPGKGVCDVAP